MKTSKFFCFAAICFFSFSATATVVNFDFTAESTGVTYSRITINAETALGNIYFSRYIDSSSELFDLTTNSPASIYSNTTGSTSAVNEFFNANQSFSGSVSYDSNSYFDGWKASTTSLEVNLVDPTSGNLNQYTDTTDSGYVTAYGDTFGFGVSSAFNSFSLEDPAAASQGWIIDFTDTSEILGYSGNSSLQAIESALSANELAFLSNVVVQTPSKWSSLMFYGSAEIEENYTDVPSDLNVTDSGSGYLMLSSTLCSPCDVLIDVNDPTIDYINVNSVSFSTNARMTFDVIEEPSANDIFEEYSQTGVLPETEIKGVFEIYDSFKSSSDLLYQTVGWDSDGYSLSENTFVFEDIEVGLDPVLYDPVVAVGYDFQVESDSDIAFSTISVPQIGSDTEFELWAYDSSGNKSFLDTLFAGETYTFLSDVFHFELLGIDINEGLTSDSDFGVLLSFTKEGIADLFMTPILFDTDYVASPNPNTDVSAPNSLLILMLCLVGFYAKSGGNKLRLHIQDSKVPAV